MEPTEPREIKVVAKDGTGIETRYLPVESLFTLYLNDREILTFLASPEKIGELAAGFLRSSGVIEGEKDIKKISVDYNQGLIWADTEASTEIVEKLLNRRYLTSGCGGGSMLEDPLSALNIGPLKSGLTVDSGEIDLLMKGLFSGAKHYKRSGGMHSALLGGAGGVYAVAEDIGRHNAVDKVLGEALLNNIDTDDKIIATTGRISSEMLIKAARSGVPIVLSRTAATNMAVKIAASLNIMIAGYIKPDSMHVYCNWERLRERRG